MKGNGKKTRRERRKEEKNEIRRAKLERLGSGKRHTSYLMRRSGPGPVTVQPVQTQNIWPIRMKTDLMKRLEP
jgi:hypothetical protein